MKDESRTVNEVKLVFAPGELDGRKFPRRFIYQELIEDGVPLQWKFGAAPVDRDATEKDIQFAGTILIEGTQAVARW